MPAQGREFVSEEESVANGVALSALGLLLGVPICLLTLDGPWRPASIGACVVGAVVYVAFCPVRRHWIDGDHLVEQTRRGVRAMSISDISGLDYEWVPRGADLVELWDRHSSVAMRIMVVEDSAALRAELGRRLGALPARWSFDRRAMRALSMR
ncbi:hypothetical protein J1G42_07745 [Cellulomonas sp. zg-ZUI222]|uniref:DUF3093 domain-containing protein n=1 Tax=Cellulomonas wangleii TaxID=2816956 RepID=A0ABX8D199_9CELL|nr:MULTISPECIES: hypothetical protein [Cellulomonas]MBO0899856.1 hypothetical protein [Cellulomonas sp. zg-ZUI22]MBO0920717.1 hypothetical protein [Cellulomonas wangleii]MBO0922865.1 hypothetical protein [Cellulomonas wangleii]QVI61265.1 hypothetical protein KG103_12295 [Cellulomonas wangleii]